jgi:hypothetical protein
MRKLLFLGLFVLLFSCSKDDEGCPNGKVIGTSVIQDVSYVNLDNGRKIPVSSDKLKLYNAGECYEGTK